MNSPVLYQYDIIRNYNIIYYYNNCIFKNPDIIYFCNTYYRGTTHLKPARLCKSKVQKLFCESPRTLEQLLKIFKPLLPAFHKKELVKNSSTTLMVWECLAVSVPGNLGITERTINSALCQNVKPPAF